MDDLLETAIDIAESRYDAGQPFVAGAQYSRRDACRLLNWRKNVTSTIYGYMVDRETKTCPIFVTLHKSDDVSASTAYGDRLLSRSKMHWLTRTKRTLASSEVVEIVSGRVELHVFVKKDDAEGSNFYYLGRAQVESAEQSTMQNDKGMQLAVVEMLLRFESPIDAALFDYFDPVLTI